MEKTLFTRKLIPFGAGFGFQSIMRISTFEITDQRIKGALFGITIFEELLSEISLVKITPCFVGVKIEITPKVLNRRAYSFSMPELGELVNVLRRLSVNVECDRMVLDREMRRDSFNNNPIVKTIMIVFALSLLAFIIYNIFLAAKR